MDRPSFDDEMAAREMTLGMLKREPKEEGAGDRRGG